MNTIGAILLFLWVSGWSIAAIRTCLKTKALNGPDRCRTEYRTGLRLTN